jgi:hypothetical protein
VDSTIAAAVSSHDVSMPRAMVRMTTDYRIDNRQSIADALPIVGCRLPDARPMPIADYR